MASPVSSEEESIKDEVKSGSTDPYDNTSDFDLFGDYVYEPCQLGILTTPVFDIFKITVHTKKATDVTNLTKCLCDGELCTICGIVQVHDEEIDDRFVVYERREPEVIGSDGVLSITGFPVIRCAKFLRVSAKLYCMAHNAELANGSFVLDYSGAVEYDKALVDYVHGKHGYASVNHITYQHAKVAVVDTICISKDDGEIGGVHLYGSITGHLERPDGKDQNKYPAIELFNNVHGLKRTKHEAATFNSYIKLCRSGLVIPASYFLRVEARFADDTGEFTLDQDINLVAHSRGSRVETVSCKNCEILLKISWPDCYEDVPRERKVERDIDAKQVFTKDLKAINFPAIEAGLRCDPIYASPFKFSSFVEIFSVLLCIEEEDLAEIHGSVELNDQSGKICCIFEGSENCSRHKTLTIGCHPRIFEFNYNTGFEIHCDLKGRDDRGVAKGVVFWSAVTKDGFFDRRLCSVLKSDIGYVAIHYSIFQSSMQARIKVSCVATSKVKFTDTSLKVYGKINALYGSYEYPTLYDQEFYSVTIYSQAEDNGFRANLDFDLPLSKSFIALPAQDTLILNVNLKVQNAKDMTFERVEHKIEFKPYGCNLCVIEKSEYDILICVEWSNDNEPKPFSNSTVPYERSISKAKSKTRPS